MKNWKPILGIVLTFLLGALSGGLLVAGVALQRVEGFLRNGAQDVAPIVVRRLGNKLDLTAEQKTKIRTIVTTGQSRLRGIRRQVEPEIRTSLRGTVEEIKATLTPEQQAKFAALVSKNEARFGALKP